ncbi:DDE-type integrase/transposase/recombinase [Idiomarina sp. Sol25]|uniref:Mu transposase C-terminal domain-containing protein n=1 Tax=Idiomarina sp. Sol25 TaxID=3064000 RepID=UPI00294B3ECD|nr:Mu transposase C-terminal domain-containing protein [Idiomarina sp. Sol25]MDV6328545.1 DDE-type integrase/transposase/recombinase [Idiomarina sp. Sol25]
MFQINEVVRFYDTRFRVLENINTHLVWINIDDEKALPELILVDEIYGAIDEDVFERIDDPHNYLKYESPPESTIAREKRDKNLSLLKPLIELPDFYNSKSRGPVVEKIVVEFGTTKQTVYRLARKYWQRGQIPNALLPDYKNSGGKGKRRVAKDKKLGRPRKYSPGTGAIVDEPTERLFRIAIDKYILSDKGHSFPYAHRRLETMYHNYFPDVPEENLPSLWQLRHFYKREYVQTEALQKRISKKDYSKDIRPLHSTANTQVLGPGSRYEIDATIADVYLVSDSDRGNIVGRPVVYMVIDVFSRMVAGFYIGFENPSYAAALQALHVAISSKSDYCHALGFDIADDEWPCIGLPDALLADRGELLGYQIENLESNFFMRIENAPPYRGDAKGIVERHFKTMHESFGPFVPGYVTGNLVKKRGGSDYRLDAKLTITDFTQIVLSSVLQHNQFAVLDKYDRDVDMPTDLPNTPLHLWNWGIQNRTGRLRQTDSDALRIALLPRSSVTVSERGVSLSGLYYTSPEIVRLGWTHRGRDVKRPKKMMAAYDPLSADNIYLFYEKGSNKYWKCSLTDLSRQYRGSSFWDVWQLREEQKKVSAKAKVAAKESRRQHEEFVLEKISQAEASSPNKSERPNSERISAIKNNRSNEKQLERQSKAPTPDNRNKKSAEIIPLNKTSPDLDYPDYIDELFEDDD